MENLNFIKEKIQTKKYEKSSKALMEYTPINHQLEHPHIFSYDMYRVLQKTTAVDLSLYASERYLVDKVKLHFLLFNEIPDEYLNENFTCIEFSEEQKRYFSNDLNINPQKHIANAFKSLGISEDKSIKIANELFEEYKNKILVNRELLEIIYKMQDKGFEAGIITDRLRLAWDAAKSLYIDHFKSEKVSSHETGKLKTDGNFNFYEFIKRVEKNKGYKINSKRVIHVDDHEGIIQIARKAGFDTIYYNWDKHDINYFRQQIKEKLGIDI